MAESGPAVVAFSADDLCPLRTDSPHPVTVTARLEVGGREVDGFTAKAQLEARPRILSTSPLSAPEGAVVTLRGQRFGDEPSPSNRLLFNGREWSVSSWKDHEIVAVVRSDAPPGPRPRVGNLVARPEGGCPSAFFTFAIEPDEEAPPPTAPPPGGRKGGRWVVEKTWFVKPKLAGEVVLWDDGRAKPVRFRGGLAGERSLTADWTYTPKGWPTQHCHGELTFSLGGDLDTLVAGEERDVSLKVTTTGDASCHYFGSLAWDKELSLGTPVTGPGKTEKSPPKRFRIPEPRGEARDARAVLHWVLGGGNEENFVEMLRQYRWVP
jgi:hypothetical protein